MGTFVECAKRLQYDNKANKFGAFMLVAAVTNDFTDHEYWRRGCVYGNSNNVTAWYTKPSIEHQRRSTCEECDFIHLATYTKVNDKWSVRFADAMPDKIRNVMNTMLKEAGLQTEGGE